MADHMAALGFVFDSVEGLEGLAYVTVEQGQVYESPEGAYVWWAPQELPGVELWVQADRQARLQGLTPCFVAEQEEGWVFEEVRAEADETLALDGVWSGVWRAAPGAPRISAHIADFARWTPSEERVRLTGAAFAHEVRCWPDPERFADAEPERTLGAATQVGAVGEARVWLSAEMVGVERRVNRGGRGQFYVFTLALGGLRLVAVAATGMVRQRPRVGGVIAGEFWLCARPLSGHTGRPVHAEPTPE